MTWVHVVRCAVPLRVSLTMTQRLSNSYDFFLRGEEILSGGQRIHDAPFLEQRMRESQVDPDTMKDYVEGFKWGCPPVSSLVFYHP